MRPFARLALLLAAVVLAGCSAVRLAYSNADVFLRWQANHYFDFGGAQSEELDARIAGFLAWHRAQALPQYVRLANAAGERLARGLTREDLVWGYDSTRAQAREALRAAADRSAELLDRLAPEQIAHLERRFAEDNRKFAREQLARDGDERRTRRTRRTLQRLEDWFGPLNDAQRERVRRYAERVSPVYDELRDADRRRLQAEFVALVRSREAGRRLAEWASDWDRGRSPRFAAENRAFLDEVFGMLLDLDRTLSREQRRRAVERLAEYAADLHELARAQ